jgi:ribose-phosphate pyrophosphokinase
LQQAGAREPIVVAVTHALLVGTAREVLRRLPITRLVVGNTVALEHTDDLPIEVSTVAPLIADAIRRDYGDQSLADLRVRR